MLRDHGASLTCLRAVLFDITLSRREAQKGMRRWRSALTIFYASGSISIRGLVLIFAGISAHGQKATPSITLDSPVEYQVFQRRCLHSGSILVRGRLFNARHVEASVVDPRDERAPNWKKLHVRRASNEFSGEVIAEPGGFFTVEVRATGPDRSSVTAAVDHVGIGEVFVIAGQSNSTNYGEVRQTTQTGMVTSFDGSRWRIADDPQPGVQDNSTNGSFIPSFGDALYRRYNVPIGVASVGHGSTSVRQWLPAGTPVDVMPTMTRYIAKRKDGTLISDGTLFDGLLMRLQQLGPHGFRALLWHQGESDAHQSPEHEISASAYARMMRQIIHASRREAGWDFPWLVAVATYHKPDDQGSPLLRQAQRSLWQNGVALHGPDTDTLGPAYRQNQGRGVHFNDTGLKLHGRLWAAAVSDYLDGALKCERMTLR